MQPPRLPQGLWVPGPTCLLPRAGESSKGLPNCIEPGGGGGPEGVIRAPTLGLQLHGLPRTSGLDGLCLLLGLEGTLEREKKAGSISLLVSY